MNGRRYGLQIMTSRNCSMSCLVRMVLALSFTVCLVGARPAAAQGKKAVVQFTISPAAEPKPAFRYKLLPAFSERTPGNAAPFYYRALVLYLMHPLTDEDVEKYEAWIEVDREFFPNDEVQKFLAPYEPVFAELKTASLREECEWDWRIKDLRGADVISYSTQDAQTMRDLARLLNLKARLEIREERVDEALDTLGVLYQLANHLGRADMIIPGLIGVAICSITDAQLQTFSELKDAPNLYWALARFPRPFVNLYDAYDDELMILDKFLPFLSEVETAKRSPEEWEELMVRLFALSAGGLNEEFDKVKPDEQMRKRALAAAKEGLPRAKQALIESGLAPERVEQMPMGQIVLLYEKQLFHYIFDEHAKLTYLPQYQSDARRDQIETALKSDGYFGDVQNKKQILRLADNLLPSIHQAQEAVTRCDTRLAASRVVQAVRMHMAAHDGKLPKSLDEITLVPLPDSPLTGKPFVYRLVNDTAELEVIMRPSFQLVYQFSAAP